MLFRSPAGINSSLREHGSATVEVPGVGQVVLSDEDVIITETPREGWAVMSDAGASIALDLEVTEELRRLGLAREVVRLVQDARKNSGLAISDRITVAWSATDSETTEAVAEHSDWIAGEVLATTFVASSTAHEFSVAENDIGLSLRFERA